jgi:hypothetical protein
MVLQVDPNTGYSLYESDEIIDYLSRTYGDGKMAFQLKLGPLTTVTAGLAMLGRAGRVSLTRFPELCNWFCKWLITTQGGASCRNQVSQIASTLSASLDFDWERCAKACAFHKQLGAISRVVRVALSRFHFFTVPCPGRHQFSTLRAISCTARVSIRVPRIS